MHQAVFIDRDGVLIEAIVRNGKPFAIYNVADAVILDGVAEGCARLRAAGYRLVMVTNQPDVARGKVAASVIEETNRYLVKLLGLDAAYVCFHDDEDDCDCRKPRPGLLVRAAQNLKLDLASSFMVGDRWRDIEAGQRAGCKTILIDCGYDERAPTAAPDFVARSLLQTADWILGS